MISSSKKKKNATYLFLLNILLDGQNKIEQ